MNYIDYLNQEFNKYSDVNILVTDELNFNPDNEDIYIILRNLSGSVFRNSTVQPIQLEVQSANIIQAKEIILDFVKTHNNTIFQSNFTYYHQTFTTPMIQNVFQPSENTYVATMYLYGTLIISENISRIQQVFVDGVEIETNNRILNYNGVADSQPVGEQNLSNSFLITSGVVFSFTTLSLNNELMQKVRNIRLGKIPINTIFEIKLVFSDNQTEEIYSMKLDSSNLNSLNTTIDVLTLNFRR